MGRREIPALLVLLTGCAASIDPQPRPLVIESLLTPGGATQLMTVRWAATNDDPAGRDAPDASAVSLWLIREGGDSARFEPLDGAGTYRTALPIASGMTYLLHGSVNGIAVTGSTTIPLPVAITSPGRVDTIQLRPGTTQAFPTGDVVVRWTAPRARFFVAGDDLRGSFGGVSVVSDTFAPEALFITDGGASVSRWFYVFALDDNAATFFTSPPPYVDGVATIASSGVHGANGFFGSRTGDSVLLVGVR